MVQNVYSLADFEYFLLIFVRIASFVFAAPFFSDRSVPAMVRAGFSALLAIMVAGVIQPVELAYGSVIGYAVVVLKEVIVGLIMGFVANICTTIISFSGNLMDMDIGLSMVSEFDQSMNTQTTITGQTYYYFLMLMLLATNLHRYIIRAICDSFSLIPLNGADFHWDSLLNLSVKYMTDFFVIGFRIVLPVFCCMLMTNVILGVMAKVAPQMNMFSVGVQIKILVGFAAIFLTVFLFPEVVDMISEEIMRIVPEAVEGMH